LRGVVIEPFDESAVFFGGAGEGEDGNLRYDGKTEPV
jgi:hypothetical protein